jgi:tRNA(Ile)-lysidine synthase
LSQLPAEVALRLLGRAIAAVGDEGPVELGKLEALCDGLASAPAAARFRRTLAGASITRAGGRLVVERAPARRNPASKRP